MSEQKDSDYVCPQCGPDKDGPEAHARNFHTFRTDDDDLPGILERLEAVLWEARSAYAGQFDVEDIVHHVAHGHGKYKPAPVAVSDADVERAENAYCMIAGVHVMPGEKARHMRGLRAALEAYESAREVQP